MVFMGSSKYPKENHYDNFVSSHGGSCNAYTEVEYTSYQFDVTSQHFSEALDIFANCFISPTLSFSSSDREIEAIESEFNIALTDDSNRMAQIFCHQAPDNHVIRKFTWGNKQSLVDVPATFNVSMENLLKDYHRKYYLPGQMKLAVIAPKSLEELQTDVENSFSVWTSVDVEAGSLEADYKRVRLDSPTLNKVHLMSSDDYASFYDRLPLDERIMNRLYRIVPIKKTHRIILSWQLPSYVCKYRSRPTSYVGHLLGFEGPGSVLSVLKSLGFAHSFSAGVSSSNLDDNKQYSIFAIQIKLTLEGFVNWIRVVKLVFEFVEIIRRAGPQEWIFQEIKSVEQTKYGNNPLA